MQFPRKDRPPHRKGRPGALLVVRRGTARLVFLEPSLALSFLRRWNLCLWLGKREDLARAKDDAMAQHRADKPLVWPRVWERFNGVYLRCSWAEKIVQRAAWRHDRQ